MRSSFCLRKGILDGNQILKGGNKAQPGKLSFLITFLFYQLVMAGEICNWWLFEMKCGAQGDFSVWRRWNFSRSWRRFQRRGQRRGQRRRRAVRICRFPSAPAALLAPSLPLLSRTSYAWRGRGVLCEIKERIEPLVTFPFEISPLFSLFLAFILDESSLFWVKFRTEGRNKPE